MYNLTFILFCSFAGDKVDMDFENESDWTAVLANHLFAKLAISSYYRIDKKCKKKRNGNKCSCSDENCLLTGCFGDTSIGTALLSMFY